MKANKQGGSKIKEEKELEDKPKDGSSDFPSFLFADFLGKGDDVWKRGQKQNGISEGENVDVAKQSDDHQQNVKEIQGNENRKQQREMHQNAQGDKQADTNIPGTVTGRQYSAYKQNAVKVSKGNKNDVEGFSHLSLLL